MMRFSLVEYGNGVSIKSIIANSETTEGEMISAISYANEKIKKNLKINRDVFSVSDKKLRALGIAGTIRFTKNIEVEIIPKFYKRAEDSAWRESIYLMAALSKHGNVLSDERLHSTMSYINSLYDIVGRMISQEYIKNKRKPIRQYHKEYYCDYFVDGEVNFEVSFERNPDGIEQSKVLFDRMNAYNATIQSAMRQIQPYIHDLTVRNIISQSIMELGNQKNTTISARLRVPPRYGEWKTVYDLSYDVLKGMGGSYEEGKILSPGFIVNTWQMWEWFITSALMVGNTNTKVIAQDGTAWGTKKVGIKTYDVNVFPDVVVYNPNDITKIQYLVDAKYKTLVNDTTGEIDRGDLYEAYAFCKGTGAEYIYLLYPNADDNPMKHIQKKAEYHIDSVKIIILLLTVDYVSKSGNLTGLWKEIADEINCIHVQVNQA